MGNRRLNIIYDAEWKGKRETDALTKSNKKLQGSLDQTADKFNKTEKASSKASGTLKKMVAGGLLLAVGGAAVRMGGQMLQAASDVEEMQSKFNAVFKDLGGSVTQELQEFADTANRSIFELQGFAATLQDTFVPLGFARDSAADMSIQLVKLAEDLASFNNLPTQQVVEDLQSALVGNTETLRKYGVVASQTAIDAEAMAMGLDFVKGKMDAQTKANAILSLTLKSTTDAQGDAINTADSYANKVKGMEAAQQELNVALGQVFIPIAGDVVSSLTDIAKGAAEGMKAIQDMGAAVENVSTANFEAAEATQDFTEHGHKLTKILEENQDLLFKLFGRGKVIDEMKEVAAAAGDFNGSNEDLVKSLEGVFGAQVKVENEYVIVGDTIIGVTTDLMAMNEEYINARFVTLDATKGWADAAAVMSGDVVPAVEEATVAIDGYKEASLDYEVSAGQVTQAEIARTDAFIKADLAAENLADKIEAGNVVSQDAIPLYLKMGVLLQEIDGEYFPIINHSSIQSALDLAKALASTLGGLGSGNDQPDPFDPGGDDPPTANQIGDEAQGQGDSGGGNSGGGDPLAGSPIAAGASVTTINVDARGATDPAAIEQAVNRGLNRAGINANNLRRVG